MKVETAERLNVALSRIDTAKTELAQACATGSDESVEAAGDRYLDAREEMGAVMNSDGMDEALAAARKRAQG